MFVYTDSFGNLKRSEATVDIKDSRAVFGMDIGLLFADDFIATVKGFV